MTIKIAVVSPSFPPLSSGGISSAQYGLLLLLEKQDNFETKGFTFSDTDKTCENLNKQIIRSGTPLLLKKLISFLISLFFKVKDRNKTAFQTADIFSTAIGSLITALKIRKFQPDIVIISDHGAPMFFIRPFVSAKYIWVAHNNPMRFIDNPLLGDCLIADAQFSTNIEKLCLNHCSMVFVPSYHMLNELRQSHDVFKECYVIPNYLDADFIEKIEPIRHEQVSAEEYLIFIPSAGSTFKGERYIFSILQWIHNETKDINPIFLLSGTLSKSLLYEVSQLNNIRAITLGQQEYSKNIAYLKSCNLCLSPTLIESFGMAILESLVCGVPVVAFNVGGNSSLIDNGKNGYLVDYLNIDELCKKAISIINSPIDKKLIISSTKEKYSLSSIEYALINHINNLF